MIVKLGIPRLDGGAAVRAMAEAITLIRALSGGGDPVTFDGEFYQVSDLDPAAAPAPRVFTGSVGPKSLAVTGQLADGWIPSAVAVAGHSRAGDTRLPPTSHVVRDRTSREFGYPRYGGVRSVQDVQAAPVGFRPHCLIGHRTNVPLRRLALPLADAPWPMGCGPRPAMASVAGCRDPPAGPPGGV